MKNVLNKLSLIIAVCVLSVTASCSHKGYDNERAAQLCAVYESSRALDYDQIGDLIEQERYALEDIRSRYESILELPDHHSRLEKIELMVCDPAFTSMQAQSETMWRILILSQNRFSENNRKAFDDLYSLRMIVDMLADDIADL